MVLDATFLNTQFYKVRIKVKRINIGKSVAPPSTPFEKGAFGSPSNTVVNFTNIYLSIYMDLHTHTHAHTHTHIYIYMYTRTQICIHIYIEDSLLEY